MPKTTYLSIPGNQQVKPGWGPAWSYQKDIPLNNGRVRDVFKVEGGPVVIVGILMRITEGHDVAANNMAFVSDPDDGGIMTDIASNYDITGAAIGDWYWAECDGSAIIPAVSGTTLPVAAVDRGSAVGSGIVVPEGGIDVLFSGVGSAGGKGEMFVKYIPMMHNAAVVPSTASTVGGMLSSTTSSSSTSSTASTASTTSSTSSTASTTSSTSSTASTASTSSTSSTASTTSSTTTTAPG